MQDNKKTFKVLINQPNDSYEAFVKEIVKTFKPDLEVEFFNFSKELNKIGMASLSKIRFNLIVFTGGEDVSPDYYNENKGKHTFTNARRDATESDMFNLFRNTPKLGICRGSQFLTVMSGGQLIQHVVNHGISGTHPISLNSGQTIEITSTHHQMLFPFNLSKENYELIGWSTYYRSTTYLDGSDKEKELPSDFLEPEIVYYNNTKSLAIQGHPEYMDYSTDSIKTIIYLIITKLLK